MPGAAKKTSAPATQRATDKARLTDEDRAAVHDAERAVGDHLEQQRQDRVAVAEFQSGTQAIFRHLARRFEDDWVEKLPRNVKRNDDNKGRCEDTPQGRGYSADGYYCGGWHARSLHLDYIGHAGITMRLNEDVGPENWTFEPLAVAENGYPAYDSRAFWGKLTICGVSKIDLAENYSNIQEAWGDALRRCAMRFGIGTYLWSKSEVAFNIKTTSEEQGKADEEAAAEAKHTPREPDHRDALAERLGALDDATKAELQKRWTAAQIPKLKELSPEQAKVVEGMLEVLEDEARKANLSDRLGAQEVSE